MSSRHFIGVVSVFILAGCGAQPKTDPNNSSLGTYQAICEITTAQGQALTCIDFDSDQPGNSTICADLRNRYSSYGAASSEYVAVTSPNASTSCALTNPKSDYGMSCVFTGHILRYYYSLPPGFNPINDCTAQSGSPLANMK